MRSARSGTVSVTTGSAGGSGALCKVGYAVNAWTGGFTANLTVTNTGNTAYNGSIPAGGSASFGFQGTWSASDATPGSFTVNGTACTTG